MLPGFDFDQLRTFVAVADAGSLSASAPLVFLSQSSVSEQIRKLEARAGVTLFTRGKLGVAPTAAGERACWGTRGSCSRTASRHGTTCAAFRCRANCGWPLPTTFAREKSLACSGIWAWCTRRCAFT